MMMTMTEEMQDEIDQLTATVHYLKLRLEVAVLDEREACARIAEEHGHPSLRLCTTIAKAIRARTP
jgi:hypothetical protein